MGDSEKRVFPSSYFFSCGTVAFSAAVLHLYSPVYVEIFACYHDFINQGFNYHSY